MGTSVMCGVLTRSNVLLVYFSLSLYLVPADRLFALASLRCLFMLNMQSYLLINILSHSSFLSFFLYLQAFGFFSSLVKLGWNVFRNFFRFLPEQIDREKKNLHSLGLFFQISISCDGRRAG